ncbi:MAG: tail fiber protein [Pseudomonadota bacterium]
MPDNYLGEIRLFAGQHVPDGWALCDGSLLEVSAHQGLFSLLGTVYGGDGRVHFGLPDLRGRVPVHRGQGKGLSNRRLGEKGGEEIATVNGDELPPHRHAVLASSADGVVATPQSAYIASSTAAQRFRTAGASAGTMRLETVTQTGGGEPHANMAPYCAVSAIIALRGAYPNRN